MPSRISAVSLECYFPEQNNNKTEIDKDMTFQVAYIKYKANRRIINQQKMSGSRVE